MCSLDQPAPEVVAQVDAGVGGLGFAGGARRLGWIDAREVACAVIVVALDLAVGQFAGHDAPLAVALVALALAQGVVHFDERPPAVVVVVRAVARAVGVAEQLARRSEEHTSELQSQSNLVCRLLLEKKKTTIEKKSTRLNSSHSQTPYAAFSSKTNNSPPSS